MAAALETLEPEGISSILDTDLYKLTMQCAVLRFFPKTSVTYAFTNRTPNYRLSRDAFQWLQQHVKGLSQVKLAADELDYLRQTCPYLKQHGYLEFLTEFRFHPDQHVMLTFEPLPEDNEHGDVRMILHGLWADTILYEVPLLALFSKAYFKFVDCDWTYDGQRDAALSKGTTLLKNGCIFSEFGTRRRRDYHTQDLVMQGLVEASRSCDLPGKFAGTSNVHFAMRYKVPPIGTVAHEWFMGIAAATQDYAAASELALRHWVECFGIGVLNIALTDTFGTPAFLHAFARPLPEETLAGMGRQSEPSLTYAEIFAGVRQDSGNPKFFVDMMHDFCSARGLSDKTIVFSDSLNIDRCLEYKQYAEAKGFKPTFGIGTFLTNDFKRKSRPSEKSKPVNIVIKLSSAAGYHAIKLSDDLGKNTGNSEAVQSVKAQLGYTDRHWTDAEEAARW